ncbi:MAG: hypothetical protein HY922_08645 [Elusimicrobia bacterium]|nr:hypothetical protein [Elusimicrobiota bacterium]
MVPQQTGRCDDLLAPLARAEVERAGRSLPAKPALFRFCLRPLILAGRALEAAARLSPSALFNAFQDWALRRIAGPCGGLPFDNGEGLRSAAALLRSWPGAKEPALLCLMSHPLVNEDETGLNVELARHALQALSLLRPRPCRPKIVVGVDPFALSGLGPLDEPLYEGFMGHYHLGLDRQAHLRGAVGGRLMACAAWPSAALRIAADLASSKELAMALGGGVPTTSRILYTLRETLGRWRRGRPVDGGPPSAVLARLESVEEFRRFRRAYGDAGPLGKSAWRMMELWLTTLLCSAEGAYACAERGDLAGPAREALSACAAALGCKAEEAAARLAALEEEFRRETPIRERFFRFLAARVLAKGTPILLLPLRHRCSPEPRLSFGVPCLLASARAGADPIVRFRMPGEPEGEEEIARFAMSFVSRNFS